MKKNKKVLIQQPIDYFIMFEEISNKLKKSHSDDFYRLLLASKLLKTCATITEHGYEIAFKNMFPDDESLNWSLEAITIASSYRKLYEKDLNVAYVLLQTVNNEIDNMRKAVLKKEITVLIRKDEVLQEIVSYVKNLTFATMVSFPHLKLAIQRDHKDSILLKKI